MALTEKHAKLIRKVMTAVRDVPPPVDTRWKSRTLQALHTALSEPDDVIADRYRDYAIAHHSVDGSLEIDTDAVVSMSQDGAYVQAWVWVGKEEVQHGR